MSEHTFGVRCVAFSPGSDFLASVGHLNDGFLYIWTINPRTGSTKLFLSNKCTSYIRGIAWIGSNLITVGTRHVKVWRIEASAPSPSKQRSAGDAMLTNTPASPAPKILCGRNCLLGSLAEASFTCVASLSDDKAIICSEKGDVCLLDDSGRGQKLSRLTGVEFGIHCIAVDGEGDNATIWLGGEQGIVRAVALSGLSNPGTCADSPASETKSSPVVHRGTSNRIVALGCTRGRLVTIDSDHYIRAVVTSAQDTVSQQRSVVLELPAHGDAVMGVKSFSQENQLQCQFFTWSAKGSVLIWDLHGTCRASLTVKLEQQPEHGATNELVVVRALSQGAYFVSGDKYGVLRYAIRFERYLGFLLTV
jgi:WD40 repeat protein